MGKTHTVGGFLLWVALCATEALGEAARVDPAIEKRQTDGRPLLVLGNQAVQLCLDAERFTLVDLIDRRLGSHYVVEPGGRLFEILFLQRPQQFYRTAEARSINGDSAARRTYQFREEDGEKRLELDFDGCPVGFDGTTADVTVTITLDPEESVFLWELGLKTDSSLPLYEVHFPTLSGLGSSLAGSEERDYFVVPSQSGQKLDHPRSKASFGQGWIEYPSGGGAIQMVTYCDGLDHGGLYLAARDARGYRKAFCGGPLVSGKSFYWYLLHYADGEIEDGQWELPYPVAWGPIVGDWYDAAKAYRRWALSQGRWKPLHQRSDIPEWFLDLALWYQGQDRNPPEERMAKHVDHLLKIRERLGEPYAFHWYLWQKDRRHDHRYPDYFPAQPGFKEAIAQVQQAGIKVMPYINVELFDTLTSMWEEEEAEPWASRDFFGNLYKVIFDDSRKMVNMCPATPYWQDKMVSCVKTLVQDYHVDAVYLDELHVYPFLCHATTHGHPAHGGTYFYDGYRKILQRARAECGRPDLVLTGEQCTEAYTDLIDGQLNCFDLRPDSIPYFQSALRDCTIEFGLFLSRVDVGHPDRFAAKLGFTFVRGRQLGWINLDQTDLLDPAFDTQVEFLRRLARCRRACREFLVFGEFLRPPNVSAVRTYPFYWMTGMTGEPTLFHLPVLMAGAYRAPNGDLGLVFANVSSEPVSAEIPLEAEDWGLKPGKVYLRKEWQDGDWATEERVELGPTVPVEVPAYAPLVVRLKSAGS